MPFNTPAIRKAEWALVALALVLLAAAALRPSIRGNDGVGHYVYLASLLRDGDLDFTNDYTRFDALKQYPYKFSQLKRSPATGRPSNRYGIGAACFWAPLVAGTHLALKMAAPARADAMGRPYEWAVGISTAFWGSLGLALLYGRLRRGLAPWGAGAIIGGLALASPLGFYLYAHGSMSHGVGFFIAVMQLLAFERAWRHPAAGRFAWFGFWSAWLVMSRFQDASWVLVLGGALAWRLGRWAREGEEIPLRVRVIRATGLSLALAGGFFSVFWFQMGVWKILYGSWLAGPMPYLDDSAGSFSRWPAHMLDVLFSGRKGVLAWHPLYALGLAGLALLGLDRWPGVGTTNLPDGGDRFLGVVGLLGFAGQLWLIASWSIWWAGASFGNRFFISALPFIALGLGRLTRGLAATRCRRFAMAAVLAVLILWNMGLLVQYATEMIPREDWVPWARIIRQNLVDVPRLILGRLGHF